MLVVDGVPEFTELVGDGLEALTVDAHLRISLDGGAKLGMKSVDAGIDIVLEELTKGHPKGGGVGGVTEDKIKNLGGHALIDPLDDGEVVRDPARIVGARGSVGGDVIAKIAASEVNLKEMAPMVVIVLG